MPTISPTNTVVPKEIGIPVFFTNQKIVAVLKSRGEDLKPKLTYAFSPVSASMVAATSSTLLPAAGETKIADNILRCGGE